jgi:hypothetical protein
MKYKVITKHGAEEFETMLHAVRMRGIIIVAQKEDSLFEVCEGRAYMNRVYVTPEQLAALGKELLELSGVKQPEALQSAPLDKVYVQLSQAE